MEDLRFVNNNITYYVIATYYDEEYTKKNYIIYTDKNLIDNKLQVYYSLYEKVSNKEIKLVDIKTPLEKKVALSFLKEVMKTSKQSFFHVLDFLQQNPTIINSMIISKERENNYEKSIYTSSNCPKSNECFG